MRSRALLAVVLAAASLTLAVPASADPAPETPSWLAQPAKNDNQNPPPPAASSRLRTWGALFLIVAMGAAAVWVRRKKGLAPVKKGSATLSILDTARIGPKAHLVVARCGDQTFVLGVTETSIRRLSTLEAIPAEEPEESLVKEPAVAAAPKATVAEEPKVRSFAQLMKQLVRPNVVLQEKADELAARRDSAPPPSLGAHDAYRTAKAHRPARDTYEPSPRVSMSVPKARPGQRAPREFSDIEAPSQASGLLSLRAKRG